MTRADALAIRRLIRASIRGACFMPIDSPVDLANATGVISDAQHGARTTANAHQYAQIGGTHAAAAHADRTRSIYIPIGGGVASVGAPALGALSADSGITAWSFDPAAVERVAFPAIPVPDDFAAALAVFLYWSSNSGAGVVRWRVIISAKVNGDDLTAVGLRNDVAANVASGATNVLSRSANAATVAPPAQSVITLTVERVATDVGDTDAADALLYAIELEYTADM